MSDHVILLSVPGLREKDLAAMPNLSRLVAGGDRATLVPSFPCVTWPVQANMLTGKLPAEHGVVANGFFWREKNEVEMWTAWNDKIQQPQIWDLLHQHDAGLNIGRLVSDAQQGLRGGLYLHARADSQSRRQRIAVVLHEADGAVRHAARCVRPFSADEFLGADGEHQIDGLDRRFGGLGDAAVSAELLLSSICRTSTTPRRRRGRTARRRRRR